MGWPTGIRLIDALPKGGRFNSIYIGQNLLYGLDANLPPTRTARLIYVHIDAASLTDQRNVNLSDRIQFSAGTASSILIRFGAVGFLPFRYNQGKAERAKLSGRWRTHGGD
jgi:hypothetical protein